MSLGYTQCVTGMNVSLESDADVLGLLPLCNELYGDELTERRRFFIKREPQRYLKECYALYVA